MTATRPVMVSLPLSPPSCLAKSDSEHHQRLHGSAGGDRLRVLRAQEPPSSSGDDKLLPSRPLSDGCDFKGLALRG